MLRCIWLELKKNLYLPYVLLIVSGVLLFGLAVPAGRNRVGEEIAIFSMMLQGEELKMAAGIEGSDLVLWSAGTSGWLGTFLPFLLTFGYIFVFSSERQDKFLQFLRIRCGNLRYCCSKIMGGALSGGLTFTLGYALFGILMIAFFPSFSSFSPEEQEIYTGIWGGNTAGYVARRLAGSFFYGAGSCMFGIGVAVLLRDRYMLLCLPFLLNYCWIQVLNKLVIADMVYREGLYSRLIQAFDPSSLINMSWDKYWLLELMMMLVLYAGLVVLFYRLMERGYYDG